MEAILEAVLTAAVQVLLSVWFWVAVFVAVLLRLAVALYRYGKLRALGELEYGRSFSSDGIFAGETFTFTETLHNPTLFPLFAVEAFFYVPAGFTVDEVECREYTRITSIFHIPPRASVRKVHTVRADRRGCYRLETVTIRYRKHEFEFSLPFRISVFPNYTAVRAEDAPDLFRAGNDLAERKSTEDPFFLSGIRAYRVGDPMRSINFKASVRSFSGGTRQLMSNSYDSSRSFDAMIFLDLFSSDENAREETREAHLEQGLSYAAYLLTEALRQGGAVGFASNCASGKRSYLHVPCGTGSAHARQILECFAAITHTGRDYSIASLLEQISADLPSSTDVYLITPYVDARVAETLRFLERTGRNVSVIRLHGRRHHG